MTRDPNTTDRLRSIITKLQQLTAGGQLHWERQAGSAHRYARWHNNLVILGPSSPISDTRIPRYVFITPFDSPNCIEVNSDDPALGAAVMQLVKQAEETSRNEASTDPFAITEQMLERLEAM
jgi:hypothetical protein